MIPPSVCPLLLLYYKSTDVIKHTYMKTVANTSFLGLKSYKGKLVWNKYYFLPSRQQNLQKPEIMRNEESRRDSDTVNEDVKGRIWNMWSGQKQDESRSRNAPVSNTIQPICGSRGICHPTIKQVRWSQTLRNGTKIVCLAGP